MPRPAFSLLELMIGIVILGFGLVMVATMFPVAWSRARTLSQYTVERAITENAHTTVRALVRVSSVSRNVTSFEGDPLCDPGIDGVVSASDKAISACGGVRSDDRVHALHMENVQIANRRFADENPWKLADPGDPGDRLVYLGDRDDGELVGQDVVEQSFFRKRISFHERLFPPMSRRQEVDPLTGEFTGADERWDNELDTRRFCWAVFHRLRAPVVDDSSGTKINCVTDELGGARSFDMYYVTLRRGQSTFRYARQDPGFTPNPCDLTISPVPPAALDPDKDVMFPVPWRVQVQFRDEFAFDDVPTGIPTEIDVPPDGGSFDDSETLMFIQMFQRGTRFIDEINGQVYEVIEQRVSSATGKDKATLTLDREVLFDDLHIPNADPRCEPCDDTQLIDLELLRTVWVFPPPVEPRSAADAPVIFNGSPPTVAIDIRTLSVAPN